MEYWGADPREPIEVSLEKVQQSDIYVGIIAHRYGTIVEKTGKSHTQMEYEEAYKKGIPCLIYFKSDEVPILPKFMENNPESIKKLDEFKTKLKNKHKISYFENSNDLAVKVVVDLSKRIKSLDYDVLNNILNIVVRQFRQIQEDNDFKFHYLQKRLNDAGIIKTVGAMCPTCGRLLEQDEPSFGYKHPVCADCTVYRTEMVRKQLEKEHPEMLEFLPSLKKEAEEYLAKRSLRKK
jgi:predicted RNA-binding Zn-ribbon protein involved in translation (DUF1610 family)